MLRAAIARAQAAKRPRLSETVLAADALVEPEASVPRREASAESSDVDSGPERRD